MLPDLSTGKVAGSLCSGTSLTGSLPVGKSETLDKSAYKRSASWRNGIGWVCVVGMAYQLIIRDLLIWGAKQGYYILTTEPPELDGRIWSLVFGMLGIEAF